MGANGDTRIYSEEALCAVAARGAPPLRVWALHWLRGAESDPAQRALLDALASEDLSVRRAAVESLVSVELNEPVTAALLTLAAEHPGPDGDLALARLVEGGHEETIASLLARVTAREPVGDAVIEAFATKQPARLREAMRANLRVGGFTPSGAWVETFARVATSADLPWLLEEVDARDERRRAAAHVAWVSSFAAGDKSTRDWTHHLEAVRALDDARWEPPDEASQRLRRAALACLSIDPWKKALSAFRSRQWWHVMEEASLIWGRFSPGPRAPSPPGFSSAFGLLSRTRSPSEADAHLALALALGAVTRAALGPLDVARDDLARVTRWMLTFGPDCLTTLVPDYLERWYALAPDDPAREAISATLSRALMTEPSAASSCALAILLVLRDARVDVNTVLTMPSIERERALLFCQGLAFRPALLRECAEAMVGGPRGLVTRPVVLALMTRQEPWVADVLHRALERAAGSDLVVTLQALKALCDPRSLSALASTTDPALPAIANVAQFLVRVMELTAAPEALVARATFDPLTVVVRCNRCDALSSQEVYGATLHPDPERCKGDGWDGIVFERIVRCPCGAEDDYTLPPEQRFVLLAAWHSPDAFGAEGKLYEGICEVAEGRAARRRSEHIRLLRAWLDAHPNDSDAWERLGDSLREAGQRDEAVVAWRRSMEASPANLTVIIGYHEMLRDAGDLAGADALMSSALEAWPRALATLSEPAEKARWLFEGLRKMQSRSSAPYTLVHEFKTREGLVPPPVTVGGIPLEGKPADALRTAALLDPRLAALRLQVDVSGKIPSLAPHLEAGTFGPRPTRVTPKATAQAEGARLGRNDPCHCGSGQKFKKCHGR